jgi:hypothetical protein
MQAKAKPRLVDGIDRRLRTASQSTDKGVVLSKRDLQLFAALRRHAPLPTHLAFQFWRGAERAYFPYFQERLRDLFHERKGGGPFLVRPPELNPQWALGEPAWYNLSKAGLAFAASLLERGRAIPKHDPLFHRAMGACIGASFELGATGRGMRYIHCEEILARPTCPEATRRSANPLLVSIGHGKLEPDDLFGVYAPGVGYRFFVREDDRGTESFDRSNRLQSSIRAKLDKYIELMTRGEYRVQWGVPNLRVMFVTTVPGRIETLRAYLRGKAHADRFLFKALPTFGAIWRAPREPLDELFDPWEEIDGQFTFAGSG